MYFLVNKTLLASELTAPNHFTFAWSWNSLCLHIITTPTTNGIAITIFDTFPRFCSFWIPTLPTEARRTVNMNHLHSPRWHFVSHNTHFGRASFVCCFPVCMIIVYFNLLWIFVFILQYFTYDIKGRQLSPTRLNCTWPGHTVTLTLCFYMIFHNLKLKTKNISVHVKNQRRIINRHFTSDAVMTYELKH